MCNMLVMKCLLDSKGWKPKIFYKQDDFLEKQFFCELKMARRRKVMKGKDRHREKGLQQHCGK